jgi:hypothetical protein
MGRHPQPSAASIDAQTVKTTEHVLQPVERKNGAVGVRLQQAAETRSYGNRIAFLEPSGGWWEADAWGNCRPFQFESTSGGRYQSESTGDAFRAEYMPGDGLVSWPKPLGVMPAVYRRLPFQPRLLLWATSRSAPYPPSLSHGRCLQDVADLLELASQAQGCTLSRLKGLPHMGCPLRRESPTCPPAGL